MPTCSELQSTFAVCCTEPPVPLDSCICNEACVQNVLHSKLGKTYVICCLCFELLPCLTRGIRHDYSNRRALLVSKYFCMCPSTCCRWAGCACCTPLSTALDEEDASSPVTPGQACRSVYWHSAVHSVALDSWKRYRHTGYKFSLSLAMSCLAAHDLSLCGKHQACR